MWPFGKTKDHTVIEVYFHDASSGELFRKSRMPIERLPQSFEPQTTLHLGETDWDVVQARPMTSTEFRRSGKLILIVRQVKIQHADPREMLFSLPTIADELPAVEEASSKLGRNIIEIHEDDWRQVEWVHASFRDRIEEELAQIREIHDRDGDGPGFRRVHVRKAIPAPLEPAEIRLEQLRQALGDKTTSLDGLAYAGVAGVVKDGFALRLISSLEIWGTSLDGNVRAACFGSARLNNVPQPDVRNLADFAAQHDLLLVDWCPMEVILPIESDYLGYFASEGTPQ
ncbi:MAG TPA: hypothetical protein VH518_07880 [Tepidisphaeraceae bacterium]|jgi:hypothetical protein